MCSSNNVFQLLGLWEEFEANDLYAFLVAFASSNNVFQWFGLWEESKQVAFVWDPDPVFILVLL